MRPAVGVVSRSAARRLLVLVVGCLLVTSAVLAGFGAGGGDGIAAGQSTPANGTNTTNATNGTATPEETTPLDAEAQRNQSDPGGIGGVAGGNVSESIQGSADAANGSANNTTASGGSTTARGGSGDGGLFGFNMTQDVIQPTMNSTRGMLANGTTWVLNQSLEYTVGTPVPENDDDDAIVFVPTNEPWSGLYSNFFLPWVAPLTAVLALLGVIARCGIMPWQALKNPTYSQSRAFVGFILSLVALAFTMPMISFMHAFVDVLATNIAPDAAELTQSTQGLMNLSAGSILGIIAAYIIGLSQVLLLALVYAFRYGMLYIVPWFMPLMIVVIYNAPHDRLSNLSSHLLWQYVGLLIQAVPVAFLFRAALEMEWDFGLGGLMGLLASAAIFLLAAAFPLITGIAMFKSAPSVQTVAAGAAGAVAGSRATDYSRQAAGRAARGGYERMPDVKTPIKQRAAALKAWAGEKTGLGKNTPERGQATIDDYQDRTHRRRGYVPKQGKL